MLTCPQRHNREAYVLTLSSHGNCRDQFEQSKSNFDSQTTVRSPVSRETSSGLSSFISDQTKTMAVEAGSTPRLLNDTIQVSRETKEWHIAIGSLIAGLGHLVTRFI